MNNNPLLSIIVPVYNVEQYLHKCIDSILSQTFTDFELILIDDGSTDNSNKICNEYLKVDKRVIVIREDNAGQSTARNAGLDIARGNYITFVDSDDVISDKNTYYEAINKMKLNENIDILQFSSREINKSIIEKVNAVQNDVCLKNKKDFILKYRYFSNGIISDVLWDKIYKRYIFNEIKFPDGMVYEDTYIFTKIFKIINCILVTNIGMYDYIKHNNSTTNSFMTIKKFKDNFIAHNAVYEYLLEFAPKEYKIQTFVYFNIINMLTNRYKVYKDIDLSEFVLTKPIKIKGNFLMYIKNILILSLGLKNMIAFYSKIKIK